MHVTCQIVETQRSPEAPFAAPQHPCPRLPTITIQSPLLGYVPYPETRSVTRGPQPSTIDAPNQQLGERRSDKGSEPSRRLEQTERRIPRVQSLDQYLLCDAACTDHASLQTKNSITSLVSQLLANASNPTVASSVGIADRTRIAHLETGLEEARTAIGVLMDNLRLQHGLGFLAPEFPPKEDIREKGIEAHQQHRSQHVTSHIKPFYSIGSHSPSYQKPEEEKSRSFIDFQSCPQSHLGDQGRLLWLELSGKARISHLNSELAEVTQL
ncbi:hypothetical protein Efla_007682 [Eimeria flavescens]